LAKIIGVHRATVGKYETDERFPDRETLEHIADFFNVSVDYLLNRTDIRNIYDASIANSNQSHEDEKESIEDEMVSIRELLAFIKEIRRKKGNPKEDSV